MPIIRGSTGLNIFNKCDRDWDWHLLFQVPTPRKEKTKNLPSFLGMGGSLPHGETQPVRESGYHMHIESRALQALSHCLWHGRGLCHNPMEARLLFLVWIRFPLHTVDIGRHFRFPALESTHISQGACIYTPSIIQDLVREYVIASQHRLEPVRLHHSQKMDLYIPLKTHAVWLQQVLYLVFLSLTHMGPKH